MNRYLRIIITLSLLWSGVLDAEGLTIKSGGKAWDADPIKSVRDFLVKKDSELKLKDVGATKSVIESNGRYFLLYDNHAIREIDYANKKVIGEWHFKPHPVVDYELRMHDSFQEQENAGVFNDSNEYFGCLSQYPILAADVDYDGEEEILILNDTNYALDLSVFSPKRENVIFSSNVYIDMAFAPDDNMKEERGLSSKPKEPQYIYLVDGYPNAYNDGYRSFGKLFFGDINNDGRQDIILWRKYYESLLIRDTKKGFAKKDELLVHYALVDGEYKKQSTSATTIKGWLAARQLTWQKGFPSQSECPGAEGKLIPELHDPLLNDPDVLH